MPCVKGRFIGESIRLIADTMYFTKQKNIPGVAVFLDLKKLSTRLNGISYINALKLLILALTFENG